MDQSIPHVFVSCQEGADSLRKMAYQSCLRSDLDPYFFEWDLATGAFPEAFLERRMGECRLFIGIYEQDYGKRIIQTGDSSEKISALECELQIALRVLGPKNILLFARGVGERDAELNRMLVHAKLDIKPFDRDLDFALLIDEEVKKWQTQQAQPRHPKTLSIKLECKDRTGILAGIYRAIFFHGGNVVRSRQTTHLGMVNILAIAQWQEFSEHPTEDTVRQSLLHELHSLLGEETGSLEVVRIIAEYGEIKAKGNFSVVFFDGPGIAERIFSVFARSSVSVLESHLTQLSNTPPMASFFVSANATNISHEKIHHLARELRTQAGIVSAKAYMEIGSWWY